MNPRRLLLRGEVRRLLRAPGTWIALSLLALAGGFAIIHGHAVIERQKAEIAELPGHFAAQLERLKQKFPEGEHAGYWAYYLTYSAYQDPTPLSALAVGLRDVVPVAVGVRLLGLEAQLYESGLGNPAIQATGPYDLAFVLCALAPLVLLLLTHDILTRDREAGTYRLVLAQAGRPHGLFALRIGLRAVAVAAVSLGLMLAGFLTAGAPLDAVAWGWATDFLLYLGFWSAVAALIAIAARAPTASLAIAISTWVGAVVLLPTLINLAVTAALPVPEGLELTVRQRQEVHAGWDRPKEAVMTPFAARRPEWRDTPPVEGRFAWKWYYAMHEMGDVSVARESTAFRDNLLARQALLERLAWFAPPAYAQSLLSRRAGTDLDAYLGFLDHIRAFHERLKDHFYPPVFAETVYTHADLPRLPRFESAPPPASRPAAGSWPLVIAAALAFSATLFLLRRESSTP